MSLRNHDLITMMIRHWLYFHIPIMYGKNLNLTHIWHIIVLLCVQYPQSTHYMTEARLIFDPTNYSGGDKTLRQLSLSFVQHVYSQE